MDLTEAITKIQQLAINADHNPLFTHSVTLPYNGEQKSYDFETVAGENGRTLGDAVQPFRPDTLKVSTLTGFLDAINAGACGDVRSGKIIHVEDFLNVSVKSVVSDNYGVRDTLLRATHTPIDAFKFDVFYDDPQKFIIALQVAFLQTDDLLYLIQIASNLKAGASVQTNDDGFSQTLTVKAGEVRTIDVPMKPRLKLIPLRSFAEANESNPVESEFLVRFQQGRAEQPTIALFSIDGTKYKGEIMRSIKRYLEKNLLGVPILA